MKKVFALLLGILFAGALFAACPWEAAGAMDREELESSLRVESPGAGVKLSVISAGAERMYGVRADYSGGPLPGERSVVVSADLAKVKRAFGAYVKGGLFGRFWTTPVWVDSLSSLPPETQFLIWQEPSGEWGAMVPLVGGGLRTVLEGSERAVQAVASSFHQGYAPSAVPLFVVGWGDGPYKLVRGLYSFGFELMRDIDPEGVTGRPRWDKDYPQVFKYAGWCSWNAHYRTVTQDDLFKHAASFKDAGFPVRWMLIDDGWQTITNEKKNWFPWAQGGLYMASFAANKKFPGGLEKTARVLKQEYGIEYVGVWHTFQGYWDGIALDSEIGREYSDALLPVSEKAAIPDPRSDAGKRLWMDWYKHLSDAGIDFTKVDNQSTLASLTGEHLPVSKAMAQAQKNLQAASEKYMDSNMINCMEMNIDVVYQWETTNIGRSSIDYVPILPHNPRAHAVKNVMNALWIGNMVYPDYDMWKTHDQHADYHAVARAISGGPVYVTDNAGRERFEHLWPLVLSDGEIIMVDRPGLPVKRTLLADPFKDRKPLMAFARSGKAGLVALWNADKYERPVRAEVTPFDAEDMEGERFAGYEHFSKEARLLGAEDRIRVKLGRWETRLYSFVPVEDGFAPIGLVNKYVSPGTVLDTDKDDDRAVVLLAERGPFMAYCMERPAIIKADGSVIPDGKTSYAAGFVKVELGKAKPGDGEVRIEFIW